MSKAKKPRPDKYADKVKLNVTPDEAVKQLAALANKKVKDNLTPSTEEAEKAIQKRLDEGRK